MVVQRVDVDTKAVHVDTRTVQVEETGAGRYIWTAPSRVQQGRVFCGLFSLNK